MGALNPIIVALDVDNGGEALQLIDQLGDAVGFYKIGMELYAAEGTAIVQQALARKKQVFLDLKFHDIPETVKRAVSRVAALGVDLLTVHAHPQIMKAAVEGKGGSPLRLLGVTVLTSIGETDLLDLGYAPTTTIRELVQHRVRQGINLNMDGFVCSPLEVESVRKTCGPGKILVTPGVRSQGIAAGDQKRVSTPAQAIANGATYLVIGRQITRAKDPQAAARSILAELSGT